MTEDEIIQQLIYPRFHGDSSVDTKKILQRIVAAHGFRVGPTGAYYNRFRLFDRNEHEARLCANKAYYEEWLTPRRAITGEEGLPEGLEKVFKTRPAKRTGDLTGKPPSVSPEAVTLTHTFIAEMLRANPKAKVPADGNGTFTGWTAEMERFLRLDCKGDAREAEKIILFTQRDSFESGVVQSPKALRRGWNRITKKMRDDTAEWKKPKTQRQLFEEQKARLLAKEKTVDTEI